MSRLPRLFSNGYFTLRTTYGGKYQRHLVPVNIPRNALSCTLSPLRSVAPAGETKDLDSGGVDPSRLAQRLSGIQAAGEK